MRGELPAPPAGDLPLASPRMLPDEVVFVRRTMRGTAWFGVVVAGCVALATHSAQPTISVLVGMAVGIVMLWSQAFFVTRVLHRTAEKSRPRRLKLPQWGYLPLKYLLLFVVLGLLFTRHWVDGIYFVAGFLVLHVVIFCQALGQAIMGTDRKTGDVHYSGKK